MKFFKQICRIGFIVLPLFFLNITFGNAATYAANQCLSSSECGNFIYNLSLNKSVYTVNENIVVSGTFVQGTCGNSLSVGSGLWAANSLNSSWVSIFTGAFANWGQSGVVTLNAESYPSASGVDFLGSFFIFQNWAYFNIARISYTVVPVVSPPPSNPIITGPTTGTTGTPYTYSFVSTTSGGAGVIYAVSWDGGPSDPWTPAWPNFATGGIPKTAPHTWTTAGSHTVYVMAYDSNGHYSGWSQPYTVTISGPPPSTPVITGPTTGTTGTPYTFSFVSNTSGGAGVVYSVYWDGVAPASWTPAATWAASGVPQTAPQSWSIAGPHTVQAYAYDSNGQSSGWSLLHTITLSPACSALMGTPCTSAVNACGSNTGTYQCNGSCSAVPPVVPINYGIACNSAANSCGMTNSGTISCFGSCNVSIPADSLCPATLPVCPNAICETGENPLTCPQDCKVKYKTF